MTDFLVRWTRGLKHAIAEDWDQVIIVDGREGSGKSTLAAHIKAIYDGAYNMDMVSFDATDMLERMRTVPKGSCVLVDEAIMSLYKRQAMEEYQVTLAKAFSIVRARNLVFILVIPNYFDLDPHLRTRANWRLYCYARRRVRGYVDFYMPDRGPWTRGDPFLVLKYKARFGVLPTEFQQRYQAFKDEHLMGALEGFKAQVEAKVNLAQVREEYGRRGTKIQRAHEYLDDHPGATAEELANHIKASLSYARTIIRTATLSGEGGREA